MHVYFSGIGGTAIGPLALIAKQAGYEVSGSDLKDSDYLERLRQKGIGSINIGQSKEQIKSLHSRKPIDWFVYSSALPKTDPRHPELSFCRDNGIKTSKRDEFLGQILTQKNLKLIAVAGTHGKTTTTAMTIWLLQRLGMPISYSVGAKLSFGEMGALVPGSEFFVYEADEYDRNFLSFRPYFSMITGLDWDHPDIYPTRHDYNQAFRVFLSQSQWSVIWDEDFKRLGLEQSSKIMVLSHADEGTQRISLTGEVNRKNAFMVARAIKELTERPVDELFQILNAFPGLSRRFEELKPGLYSDYGHTPPKITGALQTAREVAGDDVVVIYEGLHNTRQHFIKDQLHHLFDGVKKLYIVPTYLAREDQRLKLLKPVELRNLLSHDTQLKTEAAELDEDLELKIQKHLANGDLVLALSAGGVDSLDDWLRQKFVH